MHEHMQFTGKLPVIQGPIPALHAAIAHSFAARISSPTRSTAADRSYQEKRITDACNWCIAHPCLQASEVDLTFFSQELPICSPHRIFYFLQLL